MVNIQCGDGDVFQVPEQVAIRSTLISEALQEEGITAEIPPTLASREIVEKAMTFC